MWLDGIECVCAHKNKEIQQMYAQTLTPKKKLLIDGNAVAESQCQPEVLIGE